VKGKRKGKRKEENDGEDQNHGQTLPPRLGEV
jgi:hypothetical protein